MDMFLENSDGQHLLYFDLWLLQICGQKKDFDALCSKIKSTF